MSENTKTPIHLWIVGGLTLLWNAGGAWNYVMTQLEDPSLMESMTPEQVEFYAQMSWWATSLWAVAIWGAVLGSVLLLLRKASAFPVLTVAFVSMLASTISTATSGGFAAMGAGAYAFSAVIFVIALGLVVYSRAMAARGVLT